MKTENTVWVKFPSKSSNEAFARTVASVFASQLDPTMEELGDIKTSVSEAVTNCIVHAYPESLGDITMRMKVLPDNLLEIVVKDTGCGIPDVAQARQPMFSTGGEERSGMGITIMESFMNDVRITSAQGKGTTVRMRKRIISRGDKG